MSCLRNWLAQADTDDGGRTDRLTSDEKRELAELRKRTRVLEMENDILKTGRSLLRPGERPPQIKYRLVHELADDGCDVAVACRLLDVSRSGYYEWKDRPLSARAQENETLLKHIKQIHAESRGTYGSPRVHAELTIGLDWVVNEKRVARLMREAGVQGLYRRRRHGCAIRDPHAQPSDDLVNRQFTADRPDRLWVTDITEHPTGEGKLYCAAVLDAYSRKIVGWSIADHMRTELVLDALGMAVLRRDHIQTETILHSDHGTQFTSWQFGQRLRKAEILPSMGSVGDCYDNAMMESFWGTLQLEVLDTKEWNTREELANAIFEWIEC